MSKNNGTNRLGESNFTEIYIIVFFLNILRQVRQYVEKKMLKKNFLRNELHHGFLLCFWQKRDS